MPSWLIQLLVGLVIKIGMPLLLKKFPWIPKEAQDILNALADDLNTQKQAILEVKREAHRKVIKACTVGCATELK